MRGHILVVGKSTDHTTCKPHLINFVNFTMCIILEKGCYLSVCLHKMYTCTCTVCKSAAWLSTYRTGVHFKKPSVSELCVLEVIDNIYASVCLNPGVVLYQGKEIIARYFYLLCCSRKYPNPSHRRFFSLSPPPSLEIPF